VAVAEGGAFVIEAQYTPDMGKSTRDIVPGFADLIRVAREAKGWTQSDLAERAGMTQESVSAIERERRAPSLRTASRLVAALGLLVWLHDPGQPVRAGG
jgi:ribosome-binding protein aMBF1 (putative translation factor)